MLIPVIAASLVSGCAYLHDRGRDACDMVTLSVEVPMAIASVQVGKGILGAGVGGGTGFGLRSGALGTYEYQEANAILFGCNILLPSDADQSREKGYEYDYQWYPWEDQPPRAALLEGHWCNAWQIEAVAGPGIAVRAGINLAEILDFLLGWTTLDICGDDIRTIEQREQRKKTAASGDARPPASP